MIKSRPLTKAPSHPQAGELRLGGFLPPAQHEGNHIGGGIQPVKRIGARRHRLGCPLRPALVCSDELRRFFVRRDRDVLAVTLGGDLAEPGDDAAGAGRDQPSNDDVLLEPG